MANHSPNSVIDRELLVSCGCSRATACIVMDEIERLRDVNTRLRDELHRLKDVVCREDYEIIERVLEETA